MSIESDGALNMDPSKIQTPGRDGICKTCQHQALDKYKFPFIVFPCRQSQIEEDNGITFDPKTRTFNCERFVLRLSSAHQYYKEQIINTINSLAG